MLPARPEKATGLALVRWAPLGSRQGHGSIGRKRPHTTTVVGDNLQSVQKISSTSHQVRLRPTSQDCSSSLGHESRGGGGGEVGSNRTGGIYFINPFIPLELPIPKPSRKTGFIFS